jgi:hypothetical protein
VDDGEEWANSNAPRPADPPWDIQRQGKRINVARLDLAPEKLELIDGQLYWSNEDRLTMLALLLENVGLDEVVKLAPIERWREALDARERAERQA